MLIGISGYIGSGKDTVAKMVQYLVYNEGRRKQGFAPMTYDVYCNSLPGQRDAQWADWQIKKFAAKLKQMCSLLTGIPVEDFEKQSVKDSLLGPEWETFISLNEVVEAGTGRRPLKVRELLQRFGTEAVRDKVHQNAWVNALFADYKKRLPACSGQPDFDWSILPKDEDYIYPNWVISDTRFPNEAQAIKDHGGIVVRVNRPSKTHSSHPSETSLDDWEFDWVIQNNGTIDALVGDVNEMLAHFNIS